MDTGKLVVDDVVDLNSLDSDGSISCPYCQKSSAFLYGASGMISHACSNCTRMVLWDFDNKTAYKARVRKFDK